jgi:hypothetical protein
MRPIRVGQPGSLRPIVGALWGTAYDVFERVAGACATANRTQAAMRKHAGRHPGPQ